MARRTWAKVRETPQPLDYRPFAELLADHELLQSVPYVRGDTREIYRKVRRRDGACVYCGTGPAETVDHIIPRSKGGSNRQTNLVGCCAECNQKKADMTLEEAGMSIMPQFLDRINEPYLAEE